MKREQLEHVLRAAAQPPTLQRIRELEGVPVSMQRLIGDWVETVESGRT